LTDAHISLVAICCRLHEIGSSLQEDPETLGRLHEQSGPYFLLSKSLRSLI